MNTDIRLFTDEDMKAMGKRIQNARKEKRIKAIDFANLIGIGKDQLSRIENGKVPCKMEYLFVIAPNLEVSVDYLMYGDIARKKTTKLLSDLNKLDNIMYQKAIDIIDILGK